MTEQETKNQNNDNAALVEITSELVSAYVSNNPVPVSELSSLIADVHTSLSKLSGVVAEAPAPIKPKPAVPIRSSIKEDQIICLHCGKAHKSLKRHLSSQHNQTPEQYKEFWGLDGSYPMVSPVYAEARSKLAKKMGLGRKAGASK